MSENDLDRNWQQLILTHLTERDHLGVPVVGASSPRSAATGLD